LIVKMDDIGLHLVKRPSSGVAALGRGLVRFMPVLLGALSALGTAAMIWVGGGIIVHGAEEYHLTGFPEWLHHFSVEAGQGAPFAGGFVEWLVFAIGAGFVGLIVGGLVVAGLHFFKRGKTSDHGRKEHRYDPFRHRRHAGRYVCCRDRRDRRSQGGLKGPA
jgi:predicted DNA repair protein MutK